MKWLLRIVIVLSSITSSVTAAVPSLQQQCMEVLLRDPVQILNHAFNSRAAVEVDGEATTCVPDTVWDDFAEYIVGRYQWFFQQENYTEERGHHGITYCLHPDGDIVATMCGEHLRFIDITNNEERLRLQPAQFWFNDVAFSPDGSRCFACSADDNVWCIDIENMTSETFPSTGSEVFSVAYSDEHEVLATGHKYETVTLWRKDASGAWGKVCSKSEHTSQVECLAFVPGTDLLVSAGGDGVVKVWNVNDLTCLATLEGVGEWISSLTADAHSGVIAAGGNSCGRIYWWRMDTFELMGHNDTIDPHAGGTFQAKVTSCFLVDDFLIYNVWHEGLRRNIVKVVRLSDGEKVASDVSSDFTDIQFVNNQLFLGQNYGFTRFESVKSLSIEAALLFMIHLAHPGETMTDIVDAYDVAFSVDDMEQWWAQLPEFTRNLFIFPR